MKTAITRNPRLRPGSKIQAQERGKEESSDDEDSDYEKPKAKARKQNPGSGKGKGGYMKDVKLSDELADIVGGNEMPRHEVVKRMWAYIKDNKLQDP